MLEPIHLYICHVRSIVVFLNNLISVSVSVLVSISVSVSVSVSISVSVSVSVYQRIRRWRRIQSDSLSEDAHYENNREGPIEREDSCAKTFIMWHKCDQNVELAEIPLFFTYIILQTIVVIDCLILSKDKTRQCHYISRMSLISYWP